MLGEGPKSGAEKVSSFEGMNNVIMGLYFLKWRAWWFWE